MSLRIKLAAGAVLLLFVGAFFFAPVVPYSQPLALPFAYRPNAGAICLKEAGINATNLVVVNLTQGQIYGACLNRELYPPYNLTGRASISYALLGLGSSPFPSPFEFSEGNYTGIVYFDGTEISAAYLFPPYGPTVPNSTVLVNPPGMVELVNASIGFNGFGVPVFNATVKNISASPLTSVSVGTTGLPVGLGALNFTRNGVNWLSPYEGDCSSYLAPGRSCSYQASLGPLNANELRYYVQVVGWASGQRFFLRDYVEQPSPLREPTQTWVDQFIGLVNQQRQGLPLTENATLDGFAATRFADASSVPGISDYGFSGDVASFFGPGSHMDVEELVLYPGTSSPYSYLSSLQGSFPTHYSALVNSTFAQFGYHIGSAPYYLVSADCPVNEVPSAGVNITSYFQGYGCTVTPVPDVEWLVIVLTG